MGGVLNDPAIDGSGDIRHFCLKLEAELAKMDNVEVRKGAAVDEICLDKKS